MTLRFLHRVPHLLVGISRTSNSSGSAQKIGLKKCHFPLMVQKLKLHTALRNQLKEE